VAYLVINQIEGNVLTPRIQSAAVKVHPLLVFLAVIAGGEIAGLAGAALAVPIVAMLRVLVSFFAARLRVEQPVPVALVLSADPVPTATSPPAPAAANEPAE